MTCRTLLRPLAVLVPMLAVACLEGGTGRPLGQRCEGDGDCPDPLRCAYGRCRSPCTFDRDCPEGTRCVGVPGDPSTRVCTLADEAGCNCPPGLDCDDDTGLCRERCSCSSPWSCADPLCVEVCGREGCSSGR